MNPFLFEQQRKQKRRIIETCLREKMCLLEAFRQVQRQSVLDLANRRELHRPGPEESDRDELLAALISGSVQLNGLTREIEVLEAMRSKPLYRQVQLGAVVKTNRVNYLVAVAHPPFLVGTETYAGVSPQSPLLRFAQGLLRGDSFTIAGCTYLIREIL
jgi:hypothetical protein